RRHRRDAEPLVDLGPAGVVDAGHDVVDAERLTCHARGDDVGVVTVGHGDVRGGRLDAGLHQHVAVEADTGHPQAAELGAQAAERLRIPIDDRDRVAVVLEDVGEGGTHATTSHDHNMHTPPHSAVWLDARHQYGARPERTVCQDLPGS